jgi:hypothetical protein
MCMEYFQVLIADNFISPLCVAALICRTIFDQACNKTFFTSILEINSSWWNPFNSGEMQYSERQHKVVLCIFLIISVTCSETIHTKADACNVWGDATAIRVGRVTVQAVSYWPLTTKVKSQASLCSICGGQSGNGIGFSQSTLVVPYQYHSPIAPCSFIYFFATPHTISANESPVQ